MSEKDLPLRKTMCATCPFRKGSKYAYLKRDLERSALGVSRICHSTGSGNAIHSRTGLPRHICRGARDAQLEMMAAMRYIDAPTDEAWDKRRIECGLKPTIIQDPVKKEK